MAGILIAGPAISSYDVWMVLWLDRSCRMRVVVAMMLACFAGCAAELKTETRACGQSETAMPALPLPVWQRASDVLPFTLQVGVYPDLDLAPGNRIRSGVAILSRERERMNVDTDRALMILRIAARDEGALQLYTLEPGQGEPGLVWNDSIARTILSMPNLRGVILRGRDWTMLVVDENAVAIHNAISATDGTERRLGPMDSIWFYVEE